MVIANPLDLTGDCPHCGNTLLPCANWYTLDTPDESGIVKFLREAECVNCYKLFTLEMGVEICQEMIWNAQRPILYAEGESDAEAESPDHEQPS